MTPARPRAWVSAILLLAALPLRSFAAWPTQPTQSLPVCTAAGGQFPPVSVSDGAGGVLVAWPDQRGGLGFDIYAQHVLASGVVDPAWPVNGRLICSAPQSEVWPQIVSDGAGGAIIAWQDFRNASDWDVYAHHVLASGVADPAWPVNGRALCTSSGHQDNVVMVSDGAGGAIVSWQDARAGATDIYAQHVQSGGTVDPAWPVNGRSLSTAPNGQGNSSIASDGAGGAIVAWEDLRSGVSDIYAQRVRGDGTTAWTSDGAPMCTATNSQTVPRIVPDGNGGAIVAWQDNRAGNLDIYANHILSTGIQNVSWTVDGRVVCAAAGPQSAPYAVSDGGGGAIVAWQDARTGAPDIYAQHISGIGIVDAAWPVDGRVLCSATGQQLPSALVSDGAGGAIAAWLDQRTGNFDAYAQRVLAGGTVDPAWPANGRAVCTAAGDQQGIGVVLDDNGGAIFSWYDARSGEAHIYAERVARHGYLGAPEPQIVAVSDVPNDQGGQVKLSWLASWLDTDPSQVVDHYWIFRSVPLTAASRALQGGARLVGAGDVSGGSWPEGALLVRSVGAQVDFWEFVATQQAYHVLSGYSRIASTLSDSTGAYNPPTKFMIMAWDAGGTLHWDSAPMSGYSVDNLAPAAPAPFTGNYGGGATHLHWHPNSEADLSGYRLYRGGSADFVPSAGTLVAAQPDTGFADVGPAGSWYKLSAVDVHGNESGFTLLGPTQVTGVVSRGVHLALALGRPVPNPARGPVELTLALPQDARLRLSIYDVGGRLVRVILNGELPAGEHRATWDLRDGRGGLVPGGLYFVELSTGGRRLAQRIVASR